MTCSTVLDWGSVFDVLMTSFFVVSILQLEVVVSAALCEMCWQAVMELLSYSHSIAVSSEYLLYVVMGEGLMQWFV